MLRLKVISALMLCLSGLVTLQAQIKIVPRERLDAVASPKLSADSASLRFDVKHIKADMSEDDAPQMFSFGFENIGLKPLHISRIVTTCSCATAVCPLENVDPGQKTEIRVRYNPKGHPGRFERRIFVYTDGGNAPSVVLRLSVDVESGKGENDDWPVQLGRIRMRSKEIHIRKGLKDVRKVRFVNVSDSPLKLECEEMFLPPCLKFSVSPDEVAPGKEGEIVLKYDPSMGNDLGPVRLMLKNLGVSPSQSAIIVKID